MITIRRIYDSEINGEKYKVFVDRLWPRGIAKDNAEWDEWEKDISPSHELRKWFNHDPAKWEEFKIRYTNELMNRQEELKNLKELESRYGNLTLLYAARDSEHNNAQVLRDLLMQMSDNL